MKMEEIKNEEMTALVGCEPLELAEAIAKVLDDKKGNNVKVIEVGDKTIIADYFVLATGNTNTHVRALADEVEFKIGERGVDPLRHEGKEGHSSWRVLDYASVLVHVFDREARDFYKLDKLYTDFE